MKKFIESGVLSALSFFSVAIILVTGAEISKDHAEGSPEHLLLCLMWGLDSDPRVLQASCPVSGVELQPPHPCAEGSPGLALPFHSWSRSLGPYCKLSLAQTKLPILGPAFSPGLGPNNGAYFPLTSSMTGACAFSGPKVPATYCIKSLPTDAAHCPATIPPAKNRIGKT